MAKKKEMTLLEKTSRFLYHDIWRIRARSYQGHKRFWLQQLRVIMLALRGFSEDKCQLRASALTFYTLLSIVPLVAMAFGLAKGFGLEKVLEELLYDRFAGQEVVLERIILFSQNMLENTKGGIIAGIGLLVLFWAVIRVLGNIEKSFNEIWGVKRGRSFSRKLMDYFSIMLVSMVLLILSNGITVLITTQVSMLVEKLWFLGSVSPIILLMLKILPFFVIWTLFTFIYIYMPNTKVAFRAAAVGGIMAGTIYQLLQWVYITFQVGAAKYGAIYGSFAALPLFLIWLQMSWVILLLGAEIAFADQNVDTYELEPDCLEVSERFKHLIALYISKIVIDRFVRQETPLTANEISHQLEIPIRLTNEVLFTLTSAWILIEVKRDNEDVLAYQPAMDVEQLSIVRILKAIEKKGLEGVPVAESEELSKLRTILHRFEEETSKLPDNVLLKNL